MPEPVRPSSPRRLGRYELIAPLAKGGMGEVHLARTRGVGGFERLVVVKCALPSLDERTQQMLLAEARLAATLQHTNIVQVQDVDADDGTVFLAMEYLHGQDTRAVLRRSWGHGQPLALDQALAIVLATCAGLHYAHDKHDSDGQPLEIVHRDVSPSNVFVTYDGGVKLIDFGIAKATTLPSETALGTIKGKPGYMSPEQCRCEPLDRRSDVFCVGILLYELTVGRKPFVADNEYLLVKQIIEDEPPRATAIDPAYSPALDAIVQRALAKDRRDRYPSALALQEELSAIASGLHLDVSQFALGRAMGKLFAPELEAWHVAQRAGMSLVDHVIKRTTSTFAVLDDDELELVPAAAAPPPATTTSAELPSGRSRGRGGRGTAIAFAAAGAAVAGAIAWIAWPSGHAAPVAQPIAPVAPASGPPRRELVATPRPTPPPTPAPPTPVAADAAPAAVATPKPKPPAAKPAPRPRAAKTTAPASPRGPDEIIEE